MPATKSIFAATQDADARVIKNFKGHASATRLDTRTKLLSEIRGQYPDFHVTEVEERRVSLYEYAAADKAELIEDMDDEKFMATRYWSATIRGSRKKTSSGALKDTFRFTRFQYIWNEHEYLVYYITWQDPMKSSDRMFYILHPRSPSNITSGHCHETDALILAAGKWTSQLHDEIFIFDDGQWSKSKELWSAVHGASWNDVILSADMKKNLIEDVQGFFDNQAIYEEFSVPWKRGVILHGVPGNGKTVSIKALMAALYTRSDPVPSLYVKSFETKCNTAQYAIRNIFTMARTMAPCLLVFEDLDSLVTDDIRSYFLNEVDGLESNDGILMIGSTNHLDKLDPAISKRPSRFDRKYHFQLPGEQERKAYALYWQAKLAAKGKVEVTDEVAGLIAKLTEGFSFAYLKELWVMALLSLVRGFKGDEFEIVDKEEAASADESEQDEKMEDVKEQNKSEETCTCATKCKDCDKPLPAAAAAVSAAAALAEKQIKEEKKLVMPDVDIPDHLADDLLLKVIKHQIRILLAEMDNSTGEEKRVKGGLASVYNGQEFHQKRLRAMVAGIAAARY